MACGFSARRSEDHRGPPPPRRLRNRRPRPPGSAEPPAPAARRPYFSPIAEQSAPYFEVQMSLTE